MTGKACKIMSLMRCMLLFAALTPAVWSFGQAPTTLFLFHLKADAGGDFHIYHPQMISGFNPGGYTNQPWFTAAGSILVSVRKKEEEQNDIWELFPDSRTLHRLTATRSNEYSPRIHPDGKQISVVRQVTGDSIDQQLFMFPIAGGKCQSAAPELKDIGYYTWLDNETLGLFRLEGEGNRLVLYSLRDRKTRRITTSVGRSLHTTTGGALAYVHKLTEAYWYVKTFDADSARIDILLETPAGAEDFALAPDGTYFIGHGSRLLRFHPDRDTAWKEVSDLSIYGIRKITRLALNHDATRLAVVSE